MVTKVSVSLDEEVAAEARQRVGPQRLSRFVNEAVRQRLQALRLEELEVELSREFGEVPADIREAISTEWRAEDRVAGGPTGR